MQILTKVAKDLRLKSLKSLLYCICPKAGLAMPMNIIFCFRQNSNMVYSTLPED